MRTIDTTQKMFCNYTDKQKYNLEIYSNSTDIRTTDIMQEHIHVKKCRSKNK